MDAERAFKAALNHYRKGQHLLNIREIIPQEEQALRFPAGAHFAAGGLAMALARAQVELNVYAEDEDEYEDDDDEDERR